MSEKIKVEGEAYQVLDREVKKIGNSGGIQLPKTWIGKTVKVLLLEEIDL